MQLFISFSKIYLNERTKTIDVLFGGAVNAMKQKYTSTRFK